MSTTYDLAVNYPLRSAVAERLPDALGQLRFQPADLGYPDPQGPHEARDAMATWLRDTCGHDTVAADHLVLATGARQGLWRALVAATDEAAPGVGAAGLMVDELTYHGMRAMAAALGLRCVDVRMDAEGMLPDALEAEAKRSGSRIVYLQPTLHNPTTLVMPLARRRALADVAERLGLVIIEGDVYSPLVADTLDKLPSLRALLPQRTLLAGGLGKLLGPGLRLGWLCAFDGDMARRMARAHAIETDGQPALLPRLAARWLADGTAEALRRQLCAAMVERGQLARRIIGPDLIVRGASLHAWLPGPDAVALRERLKARGVAVGDPGGYLAPGRQPPGLRLCLGAEEDAGRLETALGIVADCR